MRVIAQVKLSLIIISCVFLMAKSVGYPYLLHKKTQIQRLSMYPSMYYLIQDHIDITALPDETIEALLTLELSEVYFEWAIRLVQKGEISRSRIYWQSHVPVASENDFNRLLAALKHHNEWLALRELAQLKPLPLFYQDWLSLYKGVPPNHLGTMRLLQHNINEVPKRIIFPSQCLVKVLMVTDHLLGVARLSTLQKTYLKNPEPREMSHCFSEPYYIGNVMNCSQDGTQFAYCNWQSLEESYAELIDQVDKVVMLTQVGIANVREDLMVLNTASTYEVFLHELMHFSGFEDEYPVPHSKASWLCLNEGLHAPNLFVGEKNTAPSGWVRSNTCNNGLLQSYKPSRQWSIMEYQSTPLSEQYRMIWEQAINSNNIKN